MAELVLGPLLRHVGSDDATIWVETDEASIGRLLAVAAGVARPPIRWRILDGPSFENQIATLEIDGRTSDLTIERAAARDGGPPTLEPIVRRRLA